MKFSTWKTFSKKSVLREEFCPEAETLLLWEKKKRKSAITKKSYENSRFRVVFPLCK